MVGWLFERRLSMAQLEAELAELEEELQRLAQLETSSGSGGEGDGSQGGGVPSSRSVGGGGGGGSGTLRLSEASVRYGLGMLARSAGGPRQAVEPSNRYERQLLAEVRAGRQVDAADVDSERCLLACSCRAWHDMRPLLAARVPHLCLIDRSHGASYHPATLVTLFCQVLAPEDCGRGFSEVGALDEAKQALREAVQLPLQHPELFAGELRMRRRGRRGCRWLARVASTRTWHRRSPQHGCLPPSASISKPAHLNAHQRT